MKRTFAVVTAALAVAALTGVDVAAQTVVRGYPSYALVSVTRPGLSVKDERVYEKLEDAVVSFTFTDQPLTEAVDFLAVLSGVNIVLDRRDVEGKTVTLKLKNVSLVTALNFVTAQVDLKWTVKDGVVVVGDADATKQEPVTVVYDVLPHLAAPPDFEGPEIDLGALTRSNTDTGVEQGPWSEPIDKEKKDSEKTREELMDELVEMIRAVIAPESWEPAD